MACKLSKKGGGEFSVSTGHNFCLSAESDDGAVKLLAVHYAGETKKAAPFCFKAAAGRNALVAVIENSKPNVRTKLVENCGAGATQLLKARLFNPDDPVFAIVVVGT